MKMSWPKRARRLAGITLAAFNGEGGSGGVGFVSAAVTEGAVAQGAVPATRSASPGRVAEEDDSVSDNAAEYSPGMLTVDELYEFYRFIAAENAALALMALSADSRNNTSQHGAPLVHRAPAAASGRESDAGAAQTDVPSMVTRLSAGISPGPESSLVSQQSIPASAAGFSPPSSTHLSDVAAVGAVTLVEHCPHTGIAAFDAAQPRVVAEVLSWGRGGASYEGDSAEYDGSAIATRRGTAAIPDRKRGRAVPPPLVRPPLQPQGLRLLPRASLPRGISPAYALARALGLIA